MRYHFSDEEERLERILESQKSDKSFMIGDAVSEAMSLAFKLSEQLNFVTKLYIITETYNASMTENNAEKLDYKIAMIFSILALSSRFSIIYSAIISFKYNMN